MLKADIEKELEAAYNQFEALIEKTDVILDEEILSKKYDEIKNQLIGLQHILMDLNMAIGK